LKNISNTTDQEKPNRIVRSVELVRELSKFISKQENGTLSINIKPEHLGLLKITLDNIDNVVKARIEVENEQAKQLLERNLEKLHQELSENGVKLNSLNISLGNQKKQKGEKLTKSKNQSSNESLGQVGESEEENQKKSLGYNTYEYIA
jgi:flagellar hook-length control protein FliK